VTTFVPFFLRVYTKAKIYEKQEYTKIQYYIDGSISLDYYIEKRYET